MLKKRVIPIQLLLDGRLVKTVKFSDWRDVGDPVKSAAVYNAQLADELIFLNISRDSRGIQSLAHLIVEVSKVCFMPVTMGGGISSFEDASFLILNGADKIVVNSCAYQETDIIPRTSATFGTQAVVVGIDASYDRLAGRYVLFADGGRRRQDVLLEDHVRRIIELGAGEILIQSIDRDGTMGGYDLDLVQRVMNVSSVPVIAAGGSGNYAHLKEVFLRTDVSAVACGSLFNFSDSNPLRAKAYLANHNIETKVV